MGRLLVVDDEPLIGRTLERVLSDWEVVHVETVAAARAALAATEFDAVLCDWQLGAASGREIWDHVESSAPTLASRFIFMTGSAPQAHAEIDGLGPPVLRKPFGSNELRAALASLP